MALPNFFTLQKNVPNSTAKPVVIWDLDGTILDESLYKDCAQQVFFDVFNVVLTDDEYEKHFAQNSYCQRATHQYLDVKNVPSYDRPVLTSVFELIDLRYQELIRAGLVKTINGAVELISNLHKQGYRQCLVTGSSRLLVDDVLDLIVPDLFEVIVTSENTFWQKPHQHPYDLCFKMLDIEPTQAIVIENSIEGVRSAVESGAITISTNNTIVVPEELRANGAFAVIDVSELNTDLISLIFEHANKSLKQPISTPIISQ